MIKAETIIGELQDRLASYTDLFTEQVSISSLTRSSTTVTAVTSAVHGLTTGRYVNVIDAKSPILITSITRSETTATVVTATDHDYTEGFGMTAEIVGADQSDYNGTFDIVTVPNRRTFTYVVSGSPATPATGTIYVLNNVSTGYNGRHQVTIIDTTTFTYEITQTPLSPAQGSPIARIGIRVTGAVSAQSALNGYTKQSSDNYYAFVILGDCVTSKDRSDPTDATQTYISGQEFRQRVICPFDVMVIKPTTTEIAAREARDDMNDVAVALFRSLLRTKLTDGLTNNQQFGTVFTGHGFAAYNGAYYVHSFGFETQLDVVYEDTINPDFSVAFRDIALDFQNPNETDDDNTIMEASINLDEVAL